MISFIFMNEYMVLGFCIILTIILCAIALMHIRKWKEKHWNYSDPVITTMLETIYPLIIGLFLLWLLNGFEYLYLNKMYNDWCLRWMNRDTSSILHIENIKIFLFFMFVQFPLKSIHFILVISNLCLIYRIYRIIIQKKNYFFRDRNHEFRLIDKNGCIKKVYHSVKMWKPAYKAMELYRTEVIDYFIGKAEVFANHLSTELLYERDETVRKRKLKLHSQAINFSLSLFEYDILLHRFNTNLKTNNVSEFIHYSVPKLIEREHEINSNIPKFAEMYKMIDKKEAENMIKYAEECPYESEYMDGGWKIL